MIGLNHGVMVIVLDGNSEIGEHVNLCYLICLRHLIISRAVKNCIFSSEITNFFHACASYSELPTNISTMDNTRKRMIGLNLGVNIY